MADTLLGVRQAPRRYMSGTLRERVLEALSGKELTGLELHELIGGEKASVLAAIAGVKSQGRIVAIGKCGNYKYRLR